MFWKKAIAVSSLAASAVANVNVVLALVGAAAVAAGVTASAVEGIGRIGPRLPEVWETAVKRVVEGRMTADRSEAPPRCAQGTISAKKDFGSIL